MFLRNISQRRNHLLAALHHRPSDLSHSDLTGGLLLVEYKDAVGHINEAQSLDVLGATVFGATNAFCIEFVRGRSLPDPCALGAKVAAYYRRMSDEASGVPKFAAICRRLADTIESERIFSREQFAHELGIELG